MREQDTYQVFLASSIASTPFVFARHSWLVVSEKGTLSRWEVFWKPGQSSQSWGHLHKDFYPPFQGIEMFPFSRRFFWKDVMRHGSISGDADSLAARMVRFIQDSPRTYPYRKRYSLAGPNSNTYVQWILNEFPESGMRLPWNAFGKHKVSL